MDNFILWNVMEDSDTYRAFVLAERSRILEVSEMFASTKQLADSWTPLDLDLFDEAGEESKHVADFMGAPFTPVLSVNGCKILRNLLEKNVEFLPLKTPVNEYYAINVRPIDCLDVPNSIVERASRTNRIISVRKYAFRWEQIVSVHMFRIKEYGVNKLFVSNEFRKTYEENYLTGLIFYPVSLV